MARKTPKTRSRLSTSASTGAAGSVLLASKSSRQCRCRAKDLRSTHRCRSHSGRACQARRHQPLGHLSPRGRRLRGALARHAETCCRRSRPASRDSLRAGRTETHICLVSSARPQMLSPPGRNGSGICLPRLPYRSRSSCSPRCGQAMKILAFILDREVIERILRHIGEDTTPVVGGNWLRTAELIC